MRGRLHDARKWGVLGAIVISTVILFIRPVVALESVKLFGAPLTVGGYINQGAQFGIGGDHYDTMEGFQQGLTQFLLEGDYVPTDNLKFFVSGYWNSDFAYPIMDYVLDSHRWEFRRFKDSRSKLAFYRDYESLLKEAHTTWTLSDLGINFRIGKQIVSWGEMDGIRIMDQINPRDTRRGLSDVEFETSIIPIWLVKTEFFPKKRPLWLDDLGFEFVFNPNPDFIADKSFSTGNDEYGIWGVNVTLPSPFPPFVPPFRVGSILNDFEKPGQWNYKSYEYGFRIKGMGAGTIFTLNYFQGRENSPVSRSVGAVLEDMADPNSYDDEGNLIIHPMMQGYFPRMRFAGVSAAREFSKLRASFLGGVAPVVKLEGVYRFNSTFTTSGKGALEDFEKHDEIRAGLSIDWKVKIPFLNRKAYFTVAPQFIWQYIDDFPSLYKLSPPGAGARNSKNLYTTTLRVSTAYFLFNKMFNIEPFLYWQRDYNGGIKSDLLLGKLTWTVTDSLKYWLAVFIPLNDGYEGLHHKRNVSLNVQYSF